MSLASWAMALTSASLMGACPSESGSRPAIRKNRSVLRLTMVANASNTADTRTVPSWCGSSVGSYRNGALSLDAATSESNAAIPSTSTPDRRAEPVPFFARA